MVLHGSASNPGNDPVADIGSLHRTMRGWSHFHRARFECADRRAVIAGIGARLSVFPVGEPHTAMRGAFALCDPPHGANERLPYTRTTLHEPTSQTRVAYCGDLFS